MNERLTRRGFISAYILLAAVVLLLLATVLYRLISTRYGELSVMRKSQTARLLARAGADLTVRAFRSVLTPQGVQTGSPLYKLLKASTSLNGTDVSSYLGTDWSYALRDLALAVSPKAELTAHARLDDFTLLEDEPAKWNDPEARRGMLVVQATGVFDGVSRTLTVRRSIGICSTLPPLLPKFTLRLTGAGASESRYNVVRNTYAGKLRAGAAPWVLIHHATPTDPWKPVPIADIRKRLAQPTAWQEQGWVWLGGGRVRLHLTSGSSGFGEDFQFHPLDDDGELQTIRFNTATASLPLPWRTPQTFPCYPGGGCPATGSYSFGHWLFLMGFHDAAVPQIGPPIEPEAMYRTLPGLFSDADKAKYGAKSSSLHLFGRVCDGSAHEGCISPTRVFGSVRAVFPIVGYLDARPVEPEVRTVFFHGGSGALFPLFGAIVFDPSAALQPVPANAPGAPVLKTGDLFSNLCAYQARMSQLQEYPYTEMYNMMYQQGLPPAQRAFPVTGSGRILKEDRGGSLTVTRGSTTLYTGSITNPNGSGVVAARVQCELTTVEQFWSRFYNSDQNLLDLNGTVRILNPAGKPFVLPPEGFSMPLRVRGGGTVLLEAGEVEIRGVEAINAGLQRNEALTVAAPCSTRVLLRDQGPFHINLVAPNAELVVDPSLSPTVYGSLELMSVSTSLPQPARIMFRESQDPSRESHREFARVMLRDADEDWHD